MAGNPSVVVEHACEEGQFNLRVWAVCGCAAEIGGGGGWGGMYASLCVFVLLKSH